MPQTHNESKNDLAPKIFETLEGPLTSVWTR